MSLKMPMSRYPRTESCSTHTHRKLLKLPNKTSTESFRSITKTNQSSKRKAWILHTISQFTIRTTKKFVDLLLLNYQTEEIKRCSCWRRVTTKATWPLQSARVETASAIDSVPEIRKRTKNASRRCCQVLKMCHSLEMTNQRASLSSHPCKQIAGHQCRSKFFRYDQTCLTQK